MCGQGSLTNNLIDEDFVSVAMVRVSSKPQIIGPVSLPPGPLQ